MWCITVYLREITIQEVLIASLLAGGVLLLTMSLDISKLLQTDTYDHALQCNVLLMP